MDRSIPTQGQPFVILTVFLIVGSVAAVGIVSVDGESTEQSHTIVDTGTSTDLFPYERTHEILNIEIRANDTDMNDSEIRLYLSIAELKNNNVNISQINIDEITLSNGEVLQIEKNTTNENSYFKISMRYSDLSQPIQIESIQLDGIDASNVNISSETQYEVGITNEISNETFQDLRSEGQTEKSERFRLVNGSVKIPDQATASTNFASSSRTSSGVTVSRLVANVNSTIVLTDDENGDIVGYKSLTTEEMEDESEISLNTSNLGGKIRAYLIPTRDINISQDDIDTKLSNSSKDAAIDKDSTHIYLGTVQFEDQKYREELPTNVTMSMSEVRDTTGLNTPYIVSIHPITNEGRVAYERSIGYSDVLVGVNEDIEIPLRDTSGNKKKIWHSNRYVATIRLAEGYSAGESVVLNKTDILPNSDINKQFVDGAVSDSGDILISNIPSENDQTAKLDNKFNHTEFDGEQLYSGDTIAFRDNSSSTGQLEMHRNISSNRSVIAGIGTRINNTSYIGFNTTNLQTGSYYLNGDKFDNNNSFRIIGKNDQNIDLRDTTGSVSIGGQISERIYHNTSESTVSLSNTNTTVATAELATPSPGRTSIGINTYVVGNDSLRDDLITTGPGASVESIQTASPNGTLPPGTYEVSVESEQGLATAADNATVTVRNRSTRNLTAYATTEASADDLESADAVRAGIANGTLSPTSTVGANDTVVYAVNASGLSGLPAARNATLDTGADLDRLDGLAFGVRETGSTNETTTTSEDADDIGSVPPDSTVHLDDDGLYLVAEGTDALATDEEPADDEPFAAEFRVTDDRLREAASDSEADHAAATAVTFDEAAPDTDQTESTDENESQVDEESVDGDDGGTVETGTSGGQSTDGGTPVDDGVTTDGETASGGGSEGTDGSGGAAGSNAEGEAPSASDPHGASEERGATPKTADARSEIRPVADLRTAEINGSVAVLATSASDNDVPAMDEDGVDRTSEEGAESTKSNGDGAGADASADSQPETDTDEPEPETPDYEDAPIRTTADDVPGFGPLAALLALAATAVITRNRG